ATPGGLAAGPPEIATLLKRLGAEQRTVAWSDFMVASAGYYMAAACGEIYTKPTATVGSIGCMLTIVDDREYYEKQGIRFEHFSSAEGKLRGREGLSLSESDRKHFQESVDRAGASFRKFVEENRPLVTEEAFTGDHGDAKDFGLTNGLVDDTRLNFIELLTDLV
ncbi:MAG: S49 family peptidase, partial [Verrucomicrobiota bacterium]